MKWIAGLPNRKVLVWFGSCLFLLAGLVLSRNAVQAAAIYPAFCAGIAAAAGVFTWGNVRAKGGPTP